MKNINLNIIGTEEFISNTKEKIQKGIEKGDSIEDSVRNALPDTFPEEIKVSIINKVKKQFNN